MSALGRWRLWRVAVASAVAAGATHAAPPQTVYRCGPEGRVYSQTPCADGKPVTIDDPRSASQQRAAREVAERDAQQAKQLAEERRARDAAAQGQGMTAIKAPPTEEKASSAARKAKAKATANDSNMSPKMRVPAASAAK